MKAKETVTKKGNKVFIVELETDDDLFESTDNGEGFCIACGEFAYGCEPDARQYECESCGARKVYGIEELCLMGYVQV